MSDWQNYPVNAAPAAADTLLQLDVSDTSANAAGTVKQVTIGGLAPVLVPDAAAGLESATTTVAVSAAAAPGAGDLLMATSSVAAEWHTPAVYDAVTRYGADPAGASDSAAAIQSAIDDCVAAGAGVVYLPAGTYRVNTTLTVSLPASGTPTVVLKGDGEQATVIMSHVTGDAVRMYSASNLWCMGSGIQGLTIDGANAGAGSTGIHVGDFTGLKIDQVQVKNFSGAGSTGIWFENANNWTEETDVRLSIRNCTTGAHFSSSGTGTNSFGYGKYDFKLFESGGDYDGVSFDGTGAGAYLYHGSLRLRGNFAGSASALSGAVLRLSNGATMRGEHFDVQVETTAGTYTPTTIIVDSTSSVVGAYGILSFSAGGGTFTPASFSRGQIAFKGIISGDVNLHPSAGYNNWIFGSVGRPSQPAYTSGVTGGGFPTTLADMFDTTLSANLTVALTSSYYDGGTTMGGPQTILIRITQAASGGPYTVTWPSTASPTTSSPTVRWPGGTAPTMSTGAGAVDDYWLWTFDGATWDGVAHQAMA